MQKRNKFIFLILFEIFFILLILIVLPALFLRERPGISQTNFNETLSLNIGNTFLQEIITDKDNIQSISVLLKNPGLSNTSHVFIEVLDKDKEVLRSLTTSGVSIGDPSWITFQFPHVTSKRGDHFFIRLTTDNDKSDSLFVYGNQQNKNINYKTIFYSETLKDSLKNTITEQISLFEQRGIYSAFYILSLIALNIFLFFSL